MDSDTEFGRNGKLQLSAGVEAEDYAVRNDLDTVNMSGLFNVEGTRQGRVLMLRAFYSVERTTDSEIDQYIPGGNSLILNPSIVEESGLEATLTRDPFSAGANITYTRERYLKDRFKSGDKDTTEVDFFGRWQMTDQAGLEYRNENTRDEIVNDPADKGDWLTTETITVDWQAKLWRRPQLTFSFGVEKEDTKDQEGTWDPTYTVDVSDEYQFGSRLKLSVNANYKYEDVPEADDVAFTYGLTLAHEIGYNAKQTFSATREPRATFGSTQDTDTTTYSYQLSLNDLLLRGLGFTFGYDQEINKPPSGIEEIIDTLTVTLSHSLQISPRLNRTFSYTYTQEKSSLERDLLIENRVEWMYSYDL